MDSRVSNLSTDPCNENTVDEVSNQGQKIQLNLGNNEALSQLTRVGRWLVAIVSHRQSVVAT